ncbi:hypothetical protein Poli38472_007505 [Pythium oligandrum]|uniref:Enoyl reductase (ER) domain-containing protein n=1 Tax=Pythium oligandrum TaxID=41045 RepID=A0A8K1CRV9_PYTOL|nr:hypothetical protein Poli38472_007505 [Pythium oligandrum]|eukprot:TMW67833.1 hypothetical protein Poli38472_007505 [Pythium oligandrum]
MSPAATTLPTSFRAYVAQGFGPFQDNIVLRSDLTHAPLQPTQVRVQVFTAATNPIDHVVIETGSVFFPTAPSTDRPLRLGFDGAGVIVEAGQDVTAFNVGDEVVVLADFSCMSTFGEYLALDTAFVAHKPKNVSLHQAAGLPLAGMTSYQALLSAKLTAGDRILIIGGSSAVGAVAIQIARALGASFVATTASTRNLEFVKTFGPDQIIDYTQEKWGDVLAPHSIDVIYDCNMEPESWAGDAQRVLKKNTGRFVTADPNYKPNESPIGATCTTVYATHNQEQLEFLLKLASEGKLHVPINSVHSFEELLEVLTFQKSKKAQGKLILDIVSTKNP